MTTEYMTLAQLEAAEDKFWTEAPGKGRSTWEMLAWFLARTVAEDLEISHFDIAEMLAVSQETLDLLLQSVALFDTVHMLPPRVVAGVLLKLERHQRGLDPIA